MFAAISILSFIVICIQHTSLLMKWNSFGRGHLLQIHNNQNEDIFHAFDSKVIRTCVKSGYMQCVSNSLHKRRKRRPFKEKERMRVITMDLIETRIRRFHVHDHIRCTMYSVHTAALEVNQYNIGKKTKKKRIPSA